MRENISGLYLLSVANLHINLLYNAFSYEVHGCVGLEKAERKGKERRGGCGYKMSTRLLKIFTGFTLDGVQVRVCVCLCVCMHVSVCAVNTITIYLPFAIQRRKELQF